MAGLHLFLHKRRPEGHIMSTGWILINEYLLSDDVDDDDNDDDDKDDDNDDDDNDGDGDCR